MMRHFIFQACSLLFSIFLTCCVESVAALYPNGEVIDDVVTTIYTGGEKLKYKISWTGGVKIGELQLEVQRQADDENVFELKAVVKDSGMFHFFYPVNDVFLTRVAGDKRLPVSYEVTQKEGRNYQARRYTEYNQQAGTVRYQKNTKDPVDYTVDGEVHNEFSSFFFTRSMKLEQDYPVIVPTFADGKRHEVIVRVGAETRIKKTILGDVNVLPVTPLMGFKGLYDKAGATVIWLTNDECRIPVRIRSRILLGSLTAELLSYSNPHCGDQSEYHKKIPASVEKLPELEMGD